MELRGYSGTDEFFRARRFRLSGCGAGSGCLSRRFLRFKIGGNHVPWASLLKRGGKIMALFGVIGTVILLCIIAALWATGTMNGRQFNLRGRNKAVDRQEPRPRASGLD